jgi:hypothetical protein
MNESDYHCRACARRQSGSCLNYRRNNSRVYRCASLRAEGGVMIGWVRAIDAARAYFRAANPIKERFMSRLFGLETPLPRGQPVRARMIRLSLELSVSESTLYKWREDIMEVVLYAAIESGWSVSSPARARDEQPPEQDDKVTAD